MLFEKFINRNETIIDQEETKLSRAAESYFVNWCFLVGWWNIIGGISLVEYIITTINYDLSSMSSLF